MAGGDCLYGDGWEGKRQRRPLPPAVAAAAEPARPHQRRRPGCAGGPPPRPVEAPHATAAAARPAGCRPAARRRRPRRVRAAARGGRAARGAPVWLRRPRGGPLHPFRAATAAAGVAGVAAGARAGMNGLAVGRPRHPARPTTHDASSGDAGWRQRAARVHDASSTCMRALQRIKTEVASRSTCGMEIASFGCTYGCIGRG